MKPITGTDGKDMTPEELVNLGLQLEEMERPKAEPAAGALACDRWREHL